MKLNLNHVAYISWKYKFYQDQNYFFINCINDDRIQVVIRYQIIIVNVTLYLNDVNTISVITNFMHLRTSKFIQIQISKQKMSRVHVYVISSCVMWWTLILKLWILSRWLNIKRIFCPQYSFCRIFFFDFFE